MTVGLQGSRTVASRFGSILFGAILGAIGTYAAAFLHTVPASNKSVILRAMCIPIQIEFWECLMKGGKYSPVGNLTYVVDVPNQAVSEIPEIAEAGVQRFRKCNVVDTHNWSCRYDDNSGAFGMVRDKYYSYPIGDINKKFADTDTMKSTGQISSSCLASITAGFGTNSAICPGI